MTGHNKIAVLAGACFWGMEDLFRRRPGVVSTRVGYTGGSNRHPTYRNHPGHAEALEITYDPDETDYRALLEFFVQIHDPSWCGEGSDRSLSPLECLWPNFILSPARRLRSTNSSPHQ